MKTNPKNGLSMLIIMAALAVGNFSCKSNKKVADVSDKEAKTAVDNQPVTKTEPEVKETEPETKPKEDPIDSRTRTRYKLSDYFTAIANAPSVTSANRSIQEALNLFESPEALVLIVISEYNGKKDYDRPTTIQEYLNYLKDQKKNVNRISDFELDGSGKITELELTKN